MYWSMSGGGVKDSFVQQPGREDYSVWIPLSRSFFLTLSYCLSFFFFINVCWQIWEKSYFIVFVHLSHGFKDSLSVLEVQSFHNKHSQSRVGFLACYCVSPLQNSEWYIQIVHNPYLHERLGVRTFFFVRYTLHTNNVALVPALVHHLFWRQEVLFSMISAVDMHCSASAMQLLHFFYCQIECSNLLCLTL